MIKYLVSDHFPIMFKMYLSAILHKTASDIKQTRVYSPLFCKAFTERYDEVSSSVSFESLVSDLDVERHFEFLNTVWLDIVNIIAQSCRKVERKWKKDKLQISFNRFKNCLSFYQRAVKKAKSFCFSNLIEKHHHTPRVLFSVINSVLNSSVQSFQNPTCALCEDFLKHFGTA